VLSGSSFFNSCQAHLKIGLVWYEATKLASYQTGRGFLTCLVLVRSFLYGICETMNGNWASLYMKKLGATTTLASVALMMFWGTVTAGRIFFAAIEKWFPGAPRLRAFTLPSNRRLSRHPLSRQATPI